jgi:hypothetical protein
LGLIWITAIAGRGASTSRETLHTEVRALPHNTNSLFEFEFPGLVHSRGTGRVAHMLAADTPAIADIQAFGSLHSFQRFLKYYE